ncbi:UNVERIFIED_CONTAM: hypothetical protein FKN15_070883 [Acipenser sinensis]
MWYYSYRLASRLALYVCGLDPLGACTAIILRKSVQRCQLRELSGKERHQVTQLRASEAAQPRSFVENGVRSRRSAQTNFADGGLRMTSQLASRLALYVCGLDPLGACTAIILRKSVQRCQLRELSGKERHQVTQLRASEAAQPRSFVENGVRSRRSAQTNFADGGLRMTSQYV